MIEIPKYIIRNVEQISKYARKMEPLITSVEDWYIKHMEPYDNLNIPDEEFSDISYNERVLKEFSLKAICENFKLVEEVAKANEES